MTTPLTDCYFIVSIDVEEDMPRWVPEEKITFRNICALQKFQNLCNKYNIKPTYLVNYPVVTHTESLKILQNISNSSQCEIGTHLHPWNTPPITPGEEMNARYLSQCNSDEIQEKLKTITGLIQDRFAINPVSFRAGRFGLNMNVINVLIDQGYLVDSSVTPYCDWSPNGGPNFIDQKTDPYIIKNKHNKNIVEVPVTIGFDRKIPQWLIHLFQKYSDKFFIRAIFSKLNILQFIWLSPTLWSAVEMKRLTNFLKKKNKNIYNMMFHSSELCPGSSPYFKTEAEVNKLFSTLEEMFDYFSHEMHFHSITLKETRNFNLPEKNL